jgi:hypothetical protein
VKHVVILIEEHRVLENRALRRFFRPKWEKMRRGWRKLYYEDFINLYSSQNIVMVIQSGG